MTDWPRVLASICPKANSKIVEGFSAALPGIVQKFAINTVKRQAHFLAQCCHESDGLHTAVEYATGKEYEGRKDLGNTKPGDGVKFKGRGLIQLTGRANYETYGKKLEVNLVGNPDLAAQFPWAALTAGQYWADHGLNALADVDDIYRITRRVNGGLNGLMQRETYLAKAKRALA